MSSGRGRFAIQIRSDMTDSTQIAHPLFEKFKEYCIANGITDGEFNYIPDYGFFVFTKTTRMTSFVMDRFTQWKDTFNSDGDFTGYTLRLSLKDLHNGFITLDFFEK